MKKYLIISILMLSISSVFAQSKEKVINLPDIDKHRFHYGFYLGLNQNDFKIGYRPSNVVNKPNISTSPTTGFNVGLIGAMKINNNVNIRFEPGLISNSKTVTFNHIAGGTENIKVREVGNTYLHLPILVKLSTNRLHNIRPYVIGGGSFNYNFSSNEKNQDDNFNGEFRQVSNVFMYELGVGMDFYLSYFKFSPSVRGLFAINNELKYDNTASQWTDPIDYMGTRGVFLHLSFE